MDLGVRATAAGLAVCAAALAAASPTTAAPPGDFNGDGRSDLAIGAPFENIPETAFSAEGAVSVVEGGIAGLDPGGSGSLGLSQETPGLAGDGAKANEHFGLGLASGDFDGDGEADLVVGVPSDAVRGAEGSEENAGALHVIYGTADGLTMTGDDFITGDEAGIAGDGAEGGEQFGNELTSGDFDGDGRDDLAVSTLNETIGQANAGAVTILYGSARGLGTAGSQFFHPDSNGIAGDGADGPDQWGWATAAGDFDGDGRDDLAASSIREVLGSSGLYEGAVNVLYGGPKGLTTKGDALFSQATPGIASDPEDFDQFGIALASGDFDGDRSDDLAVSTREDGTNTFDGTGTVHVLYGGGAGLSSSGDEVLSKGLDGFPIQGDVAGDLFGETLAAGRFDSGRRDDLAIGIPGQDLAGPINDAGAVAVMYGGSSGLLGAGDGQFDAEILSQASAGIAGDGAQANDRFGGSALSVGDFDGAVREDLAIGVHAEDAVAGAVHVIYGQAEGLALDFDQFFTQGDTGVGTTEAGDFFGSALAP